MRMLKCQIILVVVSLSISSAYAWSPKGYPWYLGGEIYTARGMEDSIEDGEYLGLFVEQGIDLFQIDRSFINVFGSGNILLGGEDDKDPWNDMIEVTAGIKLRLPWEAPLTQWGEGAIGLKISHTDYFNELDDETRYVAFISWGFGGNWLKRANYK